MRRTVSVAERRGWERLPISIPFFVRGSTASGEEFLEFATALNLSAGGVLLATRRYLDPGTEISSRFPSRSSTRPNFLVPSRVSRPKSCAAPPTGSISSWA